MRPLLSFLNMMISPKGEQVVEVSNIPSHYLDIVKRIDSVDGVYRCISTGDFIDLWTAKVILNPTRYRVSKYYFEDVLMVTYNDIEFNQDGSLLPPSPATIKPA